MSSGPLHRVFSRTKRLNFYEVYLICHLWAVLLVSRLHRCCAVSPFMCRRTSHLGGVKVSFYMWLFNCPSAIY